jgi:hypothetical protein
LDDLQALRKRWQEGIGERREIPTKRRSFGIKKTQFVGVELRKGVNQDIEFWKLPETLEE